MKIIFICSSLEPGRDGVGDYIRRLSWELLRMGHSVRALALHDRYVSFDRQSNEYHEKTGQEIVMLRLSTQSSWNLRLKIAHDFIETFKPEWLSLQFVVFGFHDKGLPFLMGRCLKKVNIGSRWHIMFHELWVGMDKESSLSYRAWGLLQRQIIKELVHHLKPAAIHTQLQLYQYYLKRMGFEVDLLPLFGNIPFLKSANAQRHIDPKYLQIIIFGSVHPGAPIQEFASELAAYGRKISKSLKVIFAGRNGSEAECWINIFQSEGLWVEVIGEQSPACLSKVFFNSDIGVVSTPVMQSEKSGVLAAFREHRLPALSVARLWSPRNVNISDFPETIPVYRPGFLFDVLTDVMNVQTSYYNVHEAAKLLMSKLQPISAGVPTI